MTDLATLGRADTPGLADAVGGEVVVQHERLFAFTAQRVDDLGITLGAERRDHQRLSLATREQRRAMGAWQHAGAHGNLTYAVVVTPIDAWLTGQDATTHGGLFELGDGRPDLVLAPLGLATAEGGHGRGAHFAHAVLTVQFVDDAVGLIDVALNPRGDRFGQFRVGYRDGPFHLRYADLDDQLVDGGDDGLHLLVAEQDRVEHDLFGQHRGLGLDHQHRAAGTRHDQIELRGRELATGGVEDELTVTVTNPGTADWAGEWQAGQRYRGRCTNHRRHFGVDFGVQRHHRGDNLDLVIEALGKQRA